LLKDTSFELVAQWHTGSCARGIIGYSSIFAKTRKEIWKCCFHSPVCQWAVQRVDLRSNIKPRLGQLEGLESSVVEMQSQNQ